MSTSPVAGILAFLNRLFPHRQFYLRSRGSVQFFEFSPAFQMTIAVATIGLLGWVAYASVVVIFKEQIIIAKDQRYASMQSAYESRISQMQLAYDDMNGLLALAEERFQNSTRDLEAKHRQLTALLMQKQAMDQRFRSLRTQVANMARYAGVQYARVQPANDGSNTLAMQLATAEPALRQGRTQRTISDSAIGSVAVAVGSGLGGAPVKGALAKNHLVQKIAALERRLDVIKSEQVSLLDDLRETASRQVDRFEGILRTTGLAVDTVVAQVGGGVSRSRNGVGGPFLSTNLGAEIRASAIDGLNGDFTERFSDVAQVFMRLDSITAAMGRLPLVTPVEHGLYRSTSGYGPRADPITGRPAFHPGADMAGEYGTAIMATLPGRVVVAGTKGAYGNMIEIDHGRGIRTRYGHLLTMLVKPGDYVQFRQKIGTMGSTGRSTGPHLHYEIWFNDVHRNPTKFFDAGRNVYKG